MSNEQQHTPAELVAMHMFGIIHAIMASPRTPLHTKKATMDTLQHLFNDPKGPFQTDDDMNEMGAAFVQAMNKLVPQMKGEAMLQNIFSTETQNN